MRLVKSLGKVRAASIKCLAITWGECAAADSESIESTEFAIAIMVILCELWLPGVSTSQSIGL